MSRTYRNPRAKNKVIRTPRHKSALRAKYDEYGIRPGAVPPTNYDDLPVSAWSELENSKGDVKRIRESCLHSFLIRIRETIE